MCTKQLLNINVGSRLLWNNFLAASVFPDITAFPSVLWQYCNGICPVKPMQLTQKVLFGNNEENQEATS